MKKSYSKILLIIFVIGNFATYHNITQTRIKDCILYSILFVCCGNMIYHSYNVLKETDVCSIGVNQLLSITRDFSDDLNKIGDSCLGSRKNTIASIVYISFILFIFILIKLKDTKRICCIRNQNLPQNPSEIVVD